MKNLRYLIPAVFLFTCSLQGEEQKDPLKGFLRSFLPYAKHDDQIAAILTEALNSSGAKWRRVGKVVEDVPEVRTSYSPESEPYGNEKIAVTFSELHYAKHKTCRTLDDFYSNAENLAKEVNTPSKPYIRQNRQGETLSSTESCQLTIISRTENALCYESKRQITTKKFQKQATKPNFMGQVQEELIPCEGAADEVTPSGYYLYMIVDCGGGEFRRYIYSTEKMTPTEAERNYLLQLFEYMEAQIKNVSI